MSQEPQTLQSDTLTAQLTRKQNCVVTLDVEVSPEAVQKAWDKAVKNVNKEVSVPGFRKGKAPVAAIEKSFSKYVDSECRNILLGETFAQAMSLTTSHPYAKEGVKSDVKSLSRTEGAKLSYEYETEPEIPDFDVADMGLELPTPSTITDKDVEDAIHEMRTDSAEWKDVAGRSVQEGDYVWLDIVTTEAPAKKIGNDVRLEVARMGKWMRDLVVGKNVGDTVEGVSERDPAFDESADFVATKVKITINAIKIPELPPVDDAFAKKCGAENAETLPEYTKTMLLLRAEQKAYYHFMDKLERGILERCDTEMPLSAIDKEMRFRLFQEVTYLKKTMGLSDEDIKSQQEDIKKKVESRVFRWLCGCFVAKKIAKDADINIGNEELYQHYARQMLMTPPYYRDVDEGMPPEVIRDRLYLGLLMEKVYEHLAETKLGVTRPKRKA